MKKITKIVFYLFSDTTQKESFRLSLSCPDDVESMIPLHYSTKNAVMKLYVELDYGDHGKE